MEHSTVKFIYVSDKYDSVREKVIERIINIVSKKIDLPMLIEVEFRSLPNNVYGETLLDSRYKNRIRIQENLLAKETIVPVIHELLHLNQVCTGKLSGRRDGSFVWNGKIYNTSKNITTNEWSSLPWEIDVAEREKQMLLEVLNEA
jgi:hypothetical protein